jgi:death on curing protein
MTDYVTVAEALAIHADQIERYGGSAGVRDFGLLEAALFRPQTGYYPGLIEEAAALWESLSQNHPFVDGNERTAFAIASRTTWSRPALVSANTPCGSPYGVSWPPRPTCILAFRVSSSSFGTGFVGRGLLGFLFERVLLFHSRGRDCDRKRVQNLGALLLDINQALRHEMLL